MQRHHGLPHLVGANDQHVIVHRDAGGQHILAGGDARQTGRVLFLEILAHAIAPIAATGRAGRACAGFSSGCNCRLYRSLHPDTTTVVEASQILTHQDTATRFHPTCPFCLRAAFAWEFPTPKKQFELRQSFGYLIKVLNSGFLFPSPQST
ncbi:protein of unknown function [Burkholderia multivorans]